MAFGQGETIITPLEQAVAYATFANGGTRYAPEVAAGVVSPTGKVVKRFAPRVTGHVSLPPSVYQPILAGLQGAISNSDGTNPTGTAYQVFQGFPLNSFPLAGKTGTASVTGEEPTSWFVAFGPLPDPQYVVAVVIDQGGYGADAAAPVVRKVFDYLVNHPVGPLKLGLPPPSPGVQSSRR
jgi:penicillin-binding protein 2